MGHGLIWANMTLKTLLECEYETLGIHVSGNPLDEFKEEIKGFKNLVKSIDIEELEIGSQAYLLGKNHGS
ncbi:hypothetical protein LUA77_07560 [Helicobacter pylori]|nr:hypothetical protein LUA77_07560 [Helicobacter pylori]